MKFRIAAALILTALVAAPSMAAPAKKALAAESCPATPVLPPELAD